jgi:hypothetical protein
LAAKQTKSHLDNAPYQSEKIGWRKGNVFLKEKSFTSLKSDVRQGTTDRGSASITNLVVVEVQFRQRVVLPANHTKHTLIMPIINQKIGWRGMGTNIHPQSENETYARPSPRPEAPASPIWLAQSVNSVKDMFLLPIKHNHTLIRPNYQCEKIGGVPNLQHYL